MARRNQLQLHIVTCFHSGPLLIIAGLAGLIFVTALPSVPALTAVSILTLGATNATIARFHNSPAIIAALLLHAATYTSLYVLFLAATLHAAAASPGGILGTLPAVDLAASFVPLAIATRRVMVALRLSLER